MKKMYKLLKTFMYYVAKKYLPNSFVFNVYYNDCCGVFKLICISLPNNFTLNRFQQHFE